MIRLKQIALFATITCWAFIIGGFAYSHVVYFPAYLTHLPASTNLVTGPYGIHDDAFWKLIHPVTILVTVITLLLNWKHYPTRKFILIALGIYVLAIIATAIYFVPNLLDFANSNHITTVTAAEWLRRGLAWEHWSWLRGTSMILGFIMLLTALSKSKVHGIN